MARETKEGGEKRKMSSFPVQNTDTHQGADLSHVIFGVSQSVKCGWIHPIPYNYETGNTN